jgi:hypothetical protein
VPKGGWGIVLLYYLLYRILKDNLRTLREYINKYLIKEYIKELKSFIKAPTLFTLKADSTPRWIFNY